MAQESVVDADSGFIITNNVELTAVRDAVNPQDQQKIIAEQERRHNISISSIDSSASSSTATSDDDDDAENPVSTEIDNYTNDYLATQQENDALPVGETQGHNISSIAIKNSTNVRIGNTQEFHAPVTIQQFMIDQERKEWLEVKNGVVNEGFAKSLVDMSAGNGKISDGNPTDNLSPENQGTIAAIQKKLQNYYFIGAICCCVMMSIVIGIIFLVVYATDISDVSRVNDTSILRIVTRDEWIAQPPNNPLTPLELPSTKVIIAHTATEGCTTQAQCTFRVRFIQTFHIESRNWDDIGYNFLIGGDGAVYEGRGWLSQGAHTLRYNKKSIGIAFIGTFNNKLPPPRALAAAKLLIEEGLSQKYLSDDYKLFGHRQLIASESPGEALYNVITTWEHWSSEI
ncbi:peptidoglycan-recognition protein LC-like isoform X2 [Culicoides brevitarsis]|uniref:peptidoglycan-recognition protein LC-like isoform X2 n=1 Tax=Culicoides brevitarsis TaxID=469753 RepID=UPI00307CBBCE